MSMWGVEVAWRRQGCELGSPRGMVEHEVGVVASSAWSVRGNTSSGCYSEPERPMGGEDATELGGEGPAGCTCRCVGTLTEEVAGE